MEVKQTDYQILCGKSISEIVYKVTNYLHKGYLLSGGIHHTVVASSPTQTGQQMFYQAVYKEN